MEIIGSINNCYNIATVTGKSYVGAITSARTITVSNCGYLTGNATYGNGYQNSNTGCTVYNTIEEMPTVMEVVNVGSHYKEDTDNLNGGYPILSWQTNNDKLKLINGDNAFVEDTEGINNGYPILAWQVEEETKYTITYNLDGGTQETNPAEYTNRTANITLAEPTKTGYTFLGWTGSNGQTPEKTVTIVLGSTGDKEYTANWEAKTIKTIFMRNIDENDTTSEIQTFTYNVGGQKFTDKGWKREGYTLLGWHEDKNATEAKYETENGVGNPWINDYSPETTLYAIWAKNTET